MTLAARSDEILQLVDAERGIVERRIFSDQDLYELEIERIFGRAWNFMAHESELPKPGDFISTVIGEDKVICVRDRDGQVQILLNSCRHRGNAVCRSDFGHASSFMCAYHGWTFDLKGDLVGVPGFKEMYHEELDRSQWGLAKAAKVDSYRGFIFATMDPDAPELDDYLGEVGRYSIDNIAKKGDIKIVPGLQKYIIPCNWKYAVENVFDSYHVDITHISAFMALERNGMGPGNGTMDTYWSVMMGEHGHNQLIAVQNDELERLGTPGVHREHELWRKRYEAKKDFVSAFAATNHGNIFPNLWVSNNRMALRIPRGPFATEIWWYTFLDPAVGEEEYQRRLNQSIHGQGPAGPIEQDDGDNWTLGTRGTMSRAMRRLPFNYAADLGHGQVIEDELGPPRVSSAPAEHAQRWFYKSWSEWVASSSWAEYRHLHSPAPEGIV